MKKIFITLFFIFNIIFCFSQTTGDGGNIVLSQSPILTTPSISRQTMGAANATYSVNTTMVALTATIAATYTLTLPAANSVNTGTELLFVDEIGTITSTNNIKIKRTASDLINGDTIIVLSSAYSYSRLMSDGSSKWTLLLPTQLTGTWTPTFTGFSADPTNVVARYSLNGKWCTLTCTMTSGTSNATGFTITLPFTARAVTVHSGALAVDNGTGQGTPLRVDLAASSNIATLYKTPAGTAWTASGSKGCRMEFTYEIE